jgi:hypothetical protein
MVAEIYASISAFKTMFDMAKGLKDINDAAIRNGAVIELQEQILSAQTAQAALIQQISELEKEVADLKTWEGEKERYELVELPPGVWIRRLKESAAKAGEPIHPICCTCYEQRKISPLHASEPSMGVHHLTCNGCGAKLDVGRWQKPQANYSTRRGRGPNSWIGV